MEERHNEISPRMRINLTGLHEDWLWLDERIRQKEGRDAVAQLKRIIGLDRLCLRGPNDARDECHLAATVQNLRKLAWLRPMPA